ncbi:hypothetical protein IAR50_006779 [Cryptococcus sp. DSM 104548]
MTPSAANNRGKSGSYMEELEGAPPHPETISLRPDYLNQQTIHSSPPTGPLTSIYEFSISAPALEAGKFGTWKDTKMENLSLPYEFGVPTRRVLKMERTGGPHGSSKRTIFRVAVGPLQGLDPDTWPRSIFGNKRNYIRFPESLNTPQKQQKWIDNLRAKHEERDLNGHCTVWIAIGPAKNGIVVLTKERSVEEIRSAGGVAATVSTSPQSGGKLNHPDSTDLDTRSLPDPKRPRYTDTTGKSSNPEVSSVPSSALSSAYVPRQRQPPLPTDPRFTRPRYGATIFHPETGSAAPQTLDRSVSRQIVDGAGPIDKVSDMPARSRDDGPHQTPPLPCDSPPTRPVENPPAAAPSLAAGQTIIRQAVSSEGIPASANYPVFPLSL